MANTTTCPHCSRQFAASVKIVGRQVKCPKCGQAFVVALDESMPSLNDLDAAMPTGHEAPWTPPGPANHPSPPPRQPDPRVLWGSGIAAGVILIAVAAWALRPASKPSKPPFRDPTLPNVRPIRQMRPDGDSEPEPGCPQVTNFNDWTIDGMKSAFGENWVAHVHVHGMVQGTSDKNMVYWAVSCKVKMTTASADTAHHYLADKTTNCDYYIAPVHDLGRYSRAILDPSNRNQASGFNHPFVRRLVLTPESITSDMATRTIAIDLDKAVFKPN